MRPSIFAMLFLLLFSSGLLAHDGKKHKKDSVKTSVDSAMNAFEQGQHVQGDTVHHHNEGMLPKTSKVTADLGDFPTLHPMIVHFAIVLIIVAAVLQLLNIYWLKREITWITTGILLLGVLTAWMASRNFHPHTHGISEHAKMVLEQHDKWANWTINLGFIALVLQVVNLFVFQGKRWASTAIALVLFGSAFSVSLAGHYGAQLVHIEGIGPQGKYLEMEHHH